MYGPDIWPNYAQLLAALEALANGTSRLGAQSALKRISIDAPRFIPPAAKRKPPGRSIERNYPNVIEGFPGVACSDSTNPRLYAAWSINGALADLRTATSAASGRGRRASAPSGPATTRTATPARLTEVIANPVLIVGNRFDPATPYHGAVTLRDLLPHSALLTVEGWGYTSLFLSACADQTISRYLLTGATPATGATCRQDIVPFAQ